MKILFGLGAHMGFCSEEYCKLETCHLRHGEFEAGHPWAGYEYYAFAGFTDKTNKLTLHNHHVCEDEKFIRIPVVEGDPSNLGAAIKRYLPKLAPGQTRLFCKPMPPNTKQKFIDAGGNPNVRFYGLCHFLRRSQDLRA